MYYNQYGTQPVTGSNTCHVCGASAVLASNGGSATEPKWTPSLSWPEGEPPRSPQAGSPKTSPSSGARRWLRRVMLLVKAWVLLTISVVGWFIVYRAVGAAIVFVAGFLIGAEEAAASIVPSLVSLAIVAILLYRQYGRKTFIRIVAWTVVGLMVYIILGTALLLILYPATWDLLVLISLVLTVPLTCGLGTLWLAGADHRVNAGPS